MSRSTSLSPRTPSSPDLPGTTRNLERPPLFDNANAANTWLYAAAEQLSYTHNTGVETTCDGQGYNSGEAFSLKFEDAAGEAFQINGQVLPRRYKSRVTGDTHVLPSLTELSITYTTGYEAVEAGEPETSIVTTQISRYELSAFKKKRLGYDDVEIAMRTSDYLPEIVGLAPVEQLITPDDRTEQARAKAEKEYLQLANHARFTIETLLLAVEGYPHPIDRIEERVGRLNTSKLADGVLRRLMSKPE